MKGKRDHESTLTREVSKENKTKLYFIVISLEIFISKNKHKSDKVPRYIAFLLASYVEIFTDN